MTNWKKHTIIKNERHHLYWQFDTFRTPEGYDRLIMNTVRMLAICLSWFLITNIFNMFIWFPLMIIALTAAGVTEIRYYQNNKRLEFKLWM